MMANKLPAYLPILPGMHHLPIHSARKFTWDGDHGTCDASDFGGADIDGRVWSVACDVGFIVESPRTGRRVLFTLVEEITVRGGLLEATVYASVSRIPGHPAPLTITIVND